MNAIKRLASKVNLYDLIIINKADTLGRTTEQALKNEVPQYDYFLNIINNELKIDKKNLYKEALIINGEDLKNLGFKQGKIFGTILNEIKELTIDGKIKTKDEAILYIKKKYINKEDKEIDLI